MFVGATDVGKTEYLLSIRIISNSLSLSVYPGSEVPERPKSEKAGEEGPLAERDKPLGDRTNQMIKSRIWTFL